MTPQTARRLYRVAIDLRVAAWACRRAAGDLPSFARAQWSAYCARHVRRALSVPLARGEVGDSHRYARSLATRAEALIEIDPVAASDELERAGRGLARVLEESHGN